MKFRVARICAGALCFLLSAGCSTMMQSMMTTSVDDTASSKVLSTKGEIAGKRMKNDGNAKDLLIEPGMDLKTADLIMGSDDENSRLDLSLDERNWARFTMSDLVLRSPLGSESDTFVVVMELGDAQVFLADASDKRFEFRDTNKNFFFVEDDSAKFFVRVSDMDGTSLFVKEGEVTWTNGRSDKEVVVAPGTGIVIDDSGQESRLEAATDWVSQIDWKLERPDPNSPQPVATSSVASAAL